MSATSPMNQVSRRGLMKRIALVGAGLATAGAVKRVEAAGRSRKRPEQSSAAVQQRVGSYSLWYLEYARAPQFPVSGLLYGAHNRGTLEVPFTYTVIKGMGTVALFDVGFRAGRGFELGVSFGVDPETFETPEQVLAKIGLSPSDIEHVFIGHAHFDHFDNLPAFPNAQVYIQEREVSAWTEALRVPQQLSWITAAMNPEDIMDATRLASRGRLTLVEGEMIDVLPGISIHPAHDTHTFGSQYVTVTTRTADGGVETWALMSDAIYTYANVEGDPQYNLTPGVYVPLGYAQGNQVTQLRIMDEAVQRVGSNTNRIVPGHDAKVFERFPSRRIGPNRVAELTLAPGELSRLG